MSTVTRFAPSPTGLLHIGGVRTALFNYLYAKNQGGKFLLRIEDTDRARSTPEAIAAITNGLQWLNLQHQGISWQSQRIERHREVAESLLATDKAYYCYLTTDELAAEQTKARQRGEIYRSKWRDNSSKQILPNRNPVVRLRAPIHGKTVFQDKVYGEIAVANKQLDDMVLLRSDGMPTYIFASAVDDHDTNISHVIRGVDHLTNTSRQILLYEACAWPIPRFAHLPLIHDEKGNKLSKRHAATSLTYYQKEGFLPQAILNYLCSLGWSCDEMLTIEQAIERFDLSHINLAASRFDLNKLQHLNARYLREQSTEYLLERVTEIIRNDFSSPIHHELFLRRGLKTIINRAHTLRELAQQGLFYVAKLPLTLTTEAETAINRDILHTLYTLLTDVHWTEGKLVEQIKTCAQKHGSKHTYHALRAALTGTMQSPPLIDVLLALGREESLCRIQFFL